MNLDGKYQRHVSLAKQRQPVRPNLALFHLQLASIKTMVLNSQRWLHSKSTKWKSLGLTGISTYCNENHICSCRARKTWRNPSLGQSSLARSILSLFLSPTDAAAEPPPIGTQIPCRAEPAQPHQPRQSNASVLFWNTKSKRHGAETTASKQESVKASVPSRVHTSRRRQSQI